MNASPVRTWGSGSEEDEQWLCGGRGYLSRGNPWTGSYGSSPRTGPYRTSIHPVPPGILGVGQEGQYGAWPSGGSLKLGQPTALGCFLYRQRLGLESAARIIRSPKAPETLALGDSGPGSAAQAVNLWYGRPFHLLPPWYAWKASGPHHLGSVAPLGPHLRSSTWAPSTVSAPLRRRFCTKPNSVPHQAPRLSFTPSSEAGPDPGWIEFSLPRTWVPCCAPVHSPLHGLCTSFRRLGLAAAQY